MSDRYDHLRWQELSRTKSAEYGLFDIYTTRRTSNQSHDSQFLLVDAPDWVTIVPYLPELDSFYMVRQFRHGSSSVTLEFPAGVVNRDETPADAARRELLEETGCAGGELVSAGRVNPNPAFMTNAVHTFVATEFECGDSQKLDANEILDVETVPVDRVVSDLGGEPFTNGIMVISLIWFLRFREKYNSGET
jgi:ADP-ribose pyrophosphatase